MKLSKYLSVAFFSLTLIGCTTYVPDTRAPVPSRPVQKSQVPVIKAPPPPVQKPEQKTAPEPLVLKEVKRAAPPQNQAVIALLKTAKTQRSQGALTNAASSLERALRISPKDPVVYFQLAQVRFEQGSTDKAEQLAKKALSLDVGNSRFQTQVWNFIASCREKNGDTNGAAEARKMAGRSGRG